MSVTVTTQFVQQFDTALRTLAQQKDSRLMGTVVDRGTIEGVSFTVNNLGSAGTLDENTVRHGDTVWSEIDHTARLANMRDFFKAFPLDRADIPKMKVNPVTGGQYMSSLMFARNRRVDDIIYQAALATPSSVDGLSTYALPAGQKIAVGGTGLTKAKIIQARSIFRANECDQENGEELVMLYNDKALQQVLADTTLTSADYFTGKLLQDGNLKGSWLGFQWIPYQALNLASTVYTTIAYCKSAIHFGRGFEEGDVTKRADKKNTWQVSMASSYGACRQDDSKVVQIDFQ